MGDSSKSELSEFNLEGKFLGFAGDAVGKLKYLRLALAPQDAVTSFAAEELQIKISKELRSSLASALVPGNQIQVSGVKKLKHLTGKLKLKAYQITTATVGSEATTSTVKAFSSQPKKILVCQKSSCVKRGAKRLCKALEAAVWERGLQDQVTIERTGCLKCCSSGPNLLLMPGKTYHKRICPDAIATLLEKHL